MNLKNAFSYIFGQSCALCKLPMHSTKRLCDACFAYLPNQLQRCYYCANPLPSVTNETPCCADCIKHPPYFDRTIVSGDYQFPIDNWIYQSKFQKSLFCTAVLSDILLQTIQQHYQTIKLPECIIPVPLHSKRLRQRGYNQAMEFAKPIAKQLKLPLIYSAIRRQHATTPQTGLTAKQRKHNLKNAFTCVKKLPYTHVALIDDVITTTSTINTMAQCLRENGVTQIDVWGCARRAKRQ